MRTYPSIYLSGAPDRNGELLEYADELSEMGFDISCRRLVRDQNKHRDLSRESAEARARHYLSEDMEDMRDADTAIVVLDEWPDPAPTEYQLFELGYLRALRVPIYALGRAYRTSDWIEHQFQCHRATWDRLRLDFSALIAGHLYSPAPTDGVAEKIGEHDGTDEDWD